MSATSTPDDAGSETAVTTESEAGNPSARTTREQLLSLEGRKVKNTNEKLDVEEGVVKEVQEDNIYKGDALRALITYDGNVGKEGVVAGKLLNGEVRDWELVQDEE